VAIASADVTLVKGDLRSGCAVQLSRRVIHNIRQNLFFAFIYTLSVPIAATFSTPSWTVANPMLAAAMGLSLSVIGSVCG
jgi:Cu+-exporting ATPase